MSLDQSHERLLMPLRKDQRVKGVRPCLNILYKVHIKAFPFAIPQYVPFDLTLAYQEVIFFQASLDVNEFLHEALVFVQRQASRGVDLPVFVDRGILTAAFVGTSAVQKFSVLTMIYQEALSVIKVNVKSCAVKRDIDNHF